MSHPIHHDEDSLPTLRPRPRRPFDLSTSGPPSPSDPPTEPSSFPSQLSAALASKSGNGTPSRNRSILNLTSSTLFGIYGEEPSTPWGAGAETPVEAKDLGAEIPDTILASGPNGLKRRRRSTASARRHAPLRAKRGLKGYWLPLIGRVTALFGVGMLYGILVSHLHDRQELAPVKVEGIDRTAWPYYVFWGLAGVLLGEALPQLDALWNADDDEDIEESEEDVRRRNSGPSRKQGMVAWNDVVRSVGAFVGIAFAIRKLPWQSTLQLSVTLALANPAIWFLIDRARPLGSFCLPSSLLVELACFSASTLHSFRHLHQDRCCTNVPVMLLHKRTESKSLFLVSSLSSRWAWPPGLQACFS